MLIYVAMKRSAYTYIVFLVGLVLAGSSCSIPKALYVHLADPVSSPGFQEKHEFKAEGNLQLR